MSNLALRLRKKHRERSALKQRLSNALAREARIVSHIAWVAPVGAILFPLCYVLSLMNSGFMIFAVPLGLILFALPILLTRAFSTGLEGLEEVLRLLKTSHADQHPSPGPTTDDADHGISD